MRNKEQRNLIKHRTIARSAYIRKEVWWERYSSVEQIQRRHRLTAGLRKHGWSGSRGALVGTKCINLEVWKTGNVHEPLNTDRRRACVDGGELSCRLLGTCSRHLPTNLGDTLQRGATLRLAVAPRLMCKILWAGTNSALQMDDVSLSHLNFDFRDLRFLGSFLTQANCGHAAPGNGGLPVITSRCGFRDAGIRQVRNGKLFRCSKILHGSGGWWCSHISPSHQFLGAWYFGGMSSHFIATFNCGHSKRQVPVSYREDTVTPDNRSRHAHSILQLLRGAGLLKRLVKAAVDWATRPPRGILLQRETSHLLLHRLWHSLVTLKDDEHYISP